MKKIFLSTLGVIFASSAAAQMPPPMEMQPAQSEQFHRIEQPVSNKAIVTFGGLGLISLELWWFLFNKSPSRISRK